MFHLSFGEYLRTVILLTFISSWFNPKFHVSHPVNSKFPSCCCALVFFSPPDVLVVIWFTLEFVFFLNHLSRSSAVFQCDWQSRCRSLAGVFSERISALMRLPQITEIPKYIFSYFNLFLQFHVCMFIKWVKKKLISMLQRLFKLQYFISVSHNSVIMSLIFIYPQLSQWKNQSNSPTSQTEKTEMTVSRKAGQGSTFLPRSLFKNSASLCWQRHFFSPQQWVCFHVEAALLVLLWGWFWGEESVEWLSSPTSCLRVLLFLDIPWKKVCVSAFITLTSFMTRMNRGTTGESPLLMHVWVDGKPTSQKFSGVEGGIYRNLCLEHADNFFSFSSSGRWA